MSTANIKPAELIKADDWQFQYRQKSNCCCSNLDILSYGTFETKPGVTSGEIYRHKEESILFCIRGKVNVRIDSQTFTLSFYDTLFIPLATPYLIENVSAEQAFLEACLRRGSSRRTGHSAGPQA